MTRARGTAQRIDSPRTDPFRSAWMALTPAERMRRSWRMRSRIRDLEAYHDWKTYPELMRELRQETRRGGR